MRRRREEQLQDDITEVVKSSAKGLLGFLIKGILNAVIAAVLAMLKDKGWVDVSDDAIV